MLVDLEAALNNRYPATQSIKCAFLTRGQKVPDSLIKAAVAKHGFCFIFGVILEATGSVIGLSTECDILPLKSFAAVFSGNEAKSTQVLRDFFISLGYGADGKLYKRAFEPFVWSNKIVVHNITLIGGGFAPIINSTDNLWISEHAFELTISQI